jgi:hypothetical protein
MEHAVHLAAGHFIQGVRPTSTQALSKKVRHTFKKSRGDEHLDLDEAPAGFDDDPDGDEQEDQESNVNFEVGDVLGKALALVTQASSCL